MTSLVPTQVIKMIRMSWSKVLLISFLVLARSGFAAQPDWQKDWEQTLAAARKEGQVTVYIYRYERLLADFKKEFPASTSCR